MLQRVANRTWQETKTAIGFYALVVCGIIFIFVPWLIGICKYIEWFFKWMF